MGIEKFRRKVYAPAIVADAELTAGSVGATELASNAVTTVKITDANVTAAKLAADAVETAKILDANVTTAKIADANVTAAKLAAALVALIQGTPAFTVGAEATDVINVSCQLKDANAVAIAAAHVLRVWLSDAAGGALCAAAPSGTVVIGTNGVIVDSHVAKTHLVVATSAAGLFDLNITEVGAKTLYVNVEYQGKVFTSGAVTFA